MPSAYLDVSRGVRYPGVCPHCGQPADASRQIVAHSFIDVFFDAVPPLFAPVPVCAVARRRRRRLGALSLSAALIFIIAGAFIALEIGMNGYVRSGIALASAVAIVVIAFRTGWEDRLLDQATVGVSAWRVRSFGKLVRFSFRSDQYFSLWAAINPDASIALPAGSRPAVPRREPFAEDPIVRTRLAPAVVILVVAVILVLHHWYASYGWSPFVGTLAFLSAAAGLAVGGLVYPPVFWSLSSYGRHFSWPIKAIGVVFAVAGGIAGFLLAISYRR